MPAYRKKPESIEARRLPMSYEDAGGEDQFILKLRDIAKWCNGVLYYSRDETHIVVPAIGQADRRASCGQWIVKTNQGTTVMNDSQFNRYYEEVN